MWNHYRHKGRHTLPWRVFPQSLPAGRRAYRIVVSEVMLQQTQVARVLIFYPKFLKRFPSFHALARAPRREILRHWQGLGYNRRAVALHELAKKIVRKHAGILPHDPSQLEKLPGLGPATAGSIAAFAFNRPVVFVETNIRRVFIHHFFPHAKRVTERSIEDLVARTLPPRKSRAWYSALMDYGAWLAMHMENPNRRHEKYRRQPKFKGSSRELRGKILRYVLAHPRAVPRTIAHTLGESLPHVKRVRTTLEKEGFLPSPR